jgi:hypothetical protein
MGFWPNGCLIVPFYARLNPDQIYSPGVSDIPVAVAPTSPRDTEKDCMNPRGEEGHMETGLHIACDGCLSICCR